MHVPYAVRVEYMANVRHLERGKQSKKSRTKTSSRTMEEMKMEELKNDRTTTRNGRRRIRFSLPRRGLPFPGLRSHKGQLVGFTFAQMPAWAGNGRNRGRGRGR